MKERVKIKDIARMAGVSPGTVDRVIHKRGNVSDVKQKLVEDVLARVGYKPNLHLSSISTKRHYKVVVTIPTCAKGEYWEYVTQGIEHIVRKYDLIDISCEFYYYDQFNLYSCKEVFREVLASQPNGVVIAPTFKELTTELVAELESSQIPYIYIDSTIEGTSPLACFSADQYMCGYLIGKMIDITTPEDSEYVLFKTKRVGNISSNTTILRKSGFYSYFESCGKSGKIHNVEFSVADPDENRLLIGDYFERNPNIRGAVVLSTRGYIVADYLRERNITGVRLACVDLTDNNYKELHRGGIEFIVAQRPFQQGYLAMERLIEHLLYKNKPTQVNNVLPLDIVIKENAETYRESIVERY